MSESLERAFIEWARVSLVHLAPFAANRGWDDLTQVGAMIGDAPVVAITEVNHGAAEPLAFRNRLLQYLVEKKGFTALALESGVVEGRIVHDYVRGAEGDLSHVLAQGISWTMDRLPQNRTLIQWMRDYNADPDRRNKINFYGFDIPGSPNNPRANRGHATALIEALKYLSSVDPAAGTAFDRRLGDTHLQFGIRHPADKPGYHRLTQPERDALTAAIADLIMLLERNEADYASASTPADYEWGHRAAICARQMDNWLRQAPQDWHPVKDWNQLSHTHIAFIGRSADVRDRAMADNLEWILRREGPAGRILIFSERTHMSAVPVHWLPGAEEYPRQVAGTYLRRRLGAKLVTIGTLIGGGRLRCTGVEEHLTRAAPASIDGLASAIGPPAFVLDIRNPPGPIRDWLSQPRLVAHCPQVRRLAVGDAFDVILYFNTATPACGHVDSAAGA